MVSEKETEMLKFGFSEYSNCCFVEELQLANNKQITVNVVRIFMITLIYSTRYEKLFSYFLVSMRLISFSFIKASIGVSASILVDKISSLMSSSKGSSSWKKLNCISS